MKKAVLTEEQNSAAGLNNSLIKVEMCIFQYLQHHLPHNLLCLVSKVLISKAVLCAQGPPKKTSEQGQQFSPCCLQHMNRQMYVCMKGSFLDEWPPQSLCYKCNSAYIWKQGKWGGVAVAVILCMWRSLPSESFDTWLQTQHITQRRVETGTAMTIEMYVICGALTKWVGWDGNHGIGWYSGGVRYSLDTIEHLTLLINYPIMCRIFLFLRWFLFNKTAFGQIGVWPWQAWSICEDIDEVSPLSPN